jgi:Domain of unknown function (DUF4338)
MDTAELLQGRMVSARDVEELGGWIGSNPGWSRKRIALELCRRWEWRDAKGRLKDFAARSLLLKLEARGRIVLPALQTQKRRAPRQIVQPAGWQEPGEFHGSLRALGKVRLELVEPGSQAAKRWAFYLHKHHYLGFRVVGENLGYLASDAAGRDLACLLFGAPAWRCSSRDRALGWSPGERGRRLSTIAGNTRFLILPLARVPHLVSHLLGRVVRRINVDGHARYGHGLEWLESFVEGERFEGTCYRAANWECVGSTQGRTPPGS